MISQAITFIDFISPLLRERCCLIHTSYLTCKAELSSRYLQSDIIVVSRQLPKNFQQFSSLDWQLSTIWTFCEDICAILHLSDRSLLDISIQVRRQRREVVEVMSAKVGDLAISGEWEEIKTALKFEIKERMTMGFEGASCNIADDEGNLVENLDKTHGRVTREVLSGYKCYVIKAWIKFEKKSP